MAEKEYIDREAVLSKFLEYGIGWGAAKVKGVINSIPAADVRPVVRGKWEWNKNNGFYYCSECGSISPREDQDGEYCDCPNFCPNCGADMREES